MSQRIDDAAMDILFRVARTHRKWEAKPVGEQTLRDLYDLLKWAPTHGNAAPARFVFVQSAGAKERLRQRRKVQPAKAGVPKSKAVAPRLLQFVPHRERNSA